MFIPLFYMFYMFYPETLGLDGGFYSFWYLFPVSTALGFLLISFLQERGLFCFYGAIKGVIVFCILVLSYYLISTFSIDLRQGLDSSIISLELSPFIKTNDFTLLLCFFSLLFVGFISLFLYKGSTERSIFWMFCALLVPPLFFQTKESFILFATLASVLALVSLLQDTYRMAYIDTLTQIPARRALEESFLRLGKNYAVAMVDIDFFKKFNDSYGHDIGDEVLKLVATQLQAVKGGGKAFRYGGEEFTILFFHKDKQKILPVLEDVRKNIANRAFVIRDEDRPKEKQKVQKNSKSTKKVHISVSMGLAFAPKDGQKPENVMKTADEALYKAKKSGRNCIKTS